MFPLRPQTLAGAPLAPPRMHPQDWKPLQQFREASDPDRMAEPWDPPKFVASKDPVSQRPRTTVEELALPARCSRGGGFPGLQSFAKVIHGVLEPEECLSLLECVNAKGFTPALVNIGGGTQIFDPGYRDSSRCVVDNPELTAYLLGVIRPHLPETIRVGEGDKDVRDAEGGLKNSAAVMRLLDLNERCRFLCYHKPGQAFDAHCDGAYTRPRGHPEEGAVSVVTVQLYLNDVPSQHGGATSFLGDDHLLRGGRVFGKMGGGGKKVRCQPRGGSVLIFTQDLYHEGSRLTGGVKYALRTEAMYRRDEGGGALNGEGGEWKVLEKLSGGAVAASDSSGGGATSEAE